MMEQEIKNVQGEPSPVVESAQIDKYSFFNWALFAIPGVMLFYPFIWIFKLVFGVMESGNEKVREARLKDAEHNRWASSANKRDGATGVALINLLVVIAIVGAIYAGVKLGVDAILYLLTIQWVMYLLPLYFLGLYAAFKSSVLNDSSIKHSKALKFVLWISIPVALTVAFYVWTQGVLKSGPVFLASIFAPLFIFSLIIFPIVSSMFSLFIYLKVSSQKSKLKSAVLVLACFSLLASSATYYIVTSSSIGKQFSKMAAEKWPKKADEGPSPNELFRMKIEEQLRLKLKKAQEDAERVGGYESYPRSMVKKISSIHNGQDEALQAMSINKGKGIVDVYIQPFPFNNGKIKIAVEGVESYEYGMQMTPGTRKVTIVQEGYETVEFTAKMDEGGFYETVNMIPIE